MNKIFILIKIIKTNTLFDIFSKVGILKNQIGNQYFFTPLDDYYQAISLLQTNDLVKKVGVQLPNEIDLIEAENVLGRKAEVNHSIYDGITYYSFSVEDEYKISFIKRDSLKEQSSFKELEIVFN